MTIAEICTILRELRHAVSEVPALILAIVTAILAIITAWNKLAAALPLKNAIG
jgi:hypothetical protein